MADEGGDERADGPEPQPETQWLDEDEREAWLALLSVISLLPGALDGQLERDAGLNSFEYFVLAMLSEQPDVTMQLKHLAALTNGSLSRISHVVTRLEGRGWVQRVNLDESRGTCAVLTDSGMAKVVATAPGHVAEVRRLVFDPLRRAQVAQLTQIAGRIGRAVAERQGRKPLTGQLTGQFPGRP